MTSFDSITDVNVLETMGKKSDKKVTMESQMTMEEWKLPMLQLSDKVHMLPGIRNALLTISQFANDGYRTISHLFDGSVTVHQPSSININLSREIILHGWQDASGLCYVPI